MSLRGSAPHLVYAISPDSGAVERLGDVKVGYILMDRLNLDDKAVYFGRLRRGGYDISLWDAASGQGRVLNRSEAPVDAKR